jgi:integrase
MAKRSDRLFQRGGVWYCWFYNSKGKRVTQSTHQRDRRAAESAAREIERAHAADPAARSRSRLTLQVALQQVLDFQAVAHRSPATSRASRYHAEHLAGWLDPRKPLADITLADTTKYLQQRLGEGASRHTIAKELRTLTQAMRRVAKLGQYVPTYAPEHFIPDELGKVYEPRERWLTLDEYRALLAKLGKRYRETDEDRTDYVVAWCNLGVRKSELFDIQPRDYDVTRQELRVRGTKTELADRMVPVNAAAAEVLARRCAEAKPFPVWGMVTRDLARAAASIKIAPVTPNDFRRTFCSWLCQAGVSERVCADLLGHGSTVMVRTVYGQMDRASLAGAVARLPATKYAPATVADGAANEPGSDSTQHNDRPTSVVHKPDARDNDQPKT